MTTTETEMDTQYKGWKAVYVLRACILVTSLVCACNVQSLQNGVDKLWSFLCSTWLFNSVYFESFFATFCYTILIPVFPRLVNALPSLAKYKLNKNINFKKHPHMYRAALFYMAPLMLLDTFMVKKYHGVDPAIWRDKRQSYVQITRALPVEAPAVLQIVCHLIGSLIVYDVLFFAIHYALHKNYFLYKNIHAHHHNHDAMHAHVTNQLTVVERIALVLSANEALKFFNGHPLTRMLFVPIFITILVDNHIGFDLPFGMHRLLPFGIAGGAVNHYSHHMEGKRHYQPIFTYLDKVIQLLPQEKLMKQNHFQ